MVKSYCMELNYTFFYVESNIVCIIIFLMILLRDLRSVDRQSKQTMFDNVLMFHILYFTTDIYYVMILNGYLPHTRLTSSIANFFISFVMHMLAFYWFVYIEMLEGSFYLQTKKHRFICYIPAAISITISLILFVFFSDLVIDANLNTTVVYSISFLAVPIIYILVTAAHSIYRAFKKDNYAYRSQYLLYAAYPLSIVFFGIVQFYFFNAPMFCFGCTIMMIYFYINSLDSLISQDPLTGLNNRAQLKKYIIHDLTRNDDLKHYVMMIDLDKFKSINDVYGHIEGDRAIISAAEAIKRACHEDNSRPFIARYGGDEFIIIMRTENEKGVEELKAKLIKELEIENKKHRFNLSASIGYSSYNNTYESFLGALKEADDLLYQEKAIL